MKTRTDVIRQRYIEEELVIMRKANVVKNVRPSPFVRGSAIILLCPKYDHNVGQAVRIASCFGISTVIISGDRVPLETGDGHFRLPREERMRGYFDVTLYQYDRPMELLAPEAIPVAVEMRDKSQRLQQFVHPRKAVYIFGPEDGSIPGSVLKECHAFVKISSKHCLNLASAVSVVLHDRMAYKDEAKEHGRWA